MRVLEVARAVQNLVGFMGSPRLASQLKLELCGFYFPALKGGACGLNEYLRRD
jgi:hypothetical protein